MLPALLGLIVQFTVAAEPLIVAVNCWVEDGLPDASVQPVQMVSMLAVPGVILSPPLPVALLLFFEMALPHPANAKANGSASNTQEPSGWIRLAALPRFTRELGRPVVSSTA